MGNRRARPQPGEMPAPTPPAASGVLAAGELEQALEVLAAGGGAGGGGAPAGGGGVGAAGGGAPGPRGGGAPREPPPAPPRAPPGGAAGGEHVLDVGVEPLEALLAAQLGLARAEQGVQGIGGHWSSRWRRRARRAS